MRRLSANSFFFFFFNITEILLLFSWSSLLRTCIGLALNYLDVLFSSLLLSPCCSILILLQALSPHRGTLSGKGTLVGRFQEFTKLDGSSPLRFYCRTLTFSIKMGWTSPSFSHCLQIGLPASTCCSVTSLHPPTQILIPCRPCGASGLSQLLVFWSLWRHPGT